MAGRFPSKHTYHTIGRNEGSGVFVERDPGKSGSTRVMNEKVFREAVGKANGKFQQVTANPSKTVPPSDDRKRSR